MSLVEFLRESYKEPEDGLYSAVADGYWSNLTVDENRQLVGELKDHSARQVIREKYPHLEAAIYSPMRAAGLELLRLKGDEVCIDYGCMWGALTVPLAQRTKFVLGVDQTLESLQFLRARQKEEDITNASLLQIDLKNLPILPTGAKADVAVVNGVLEWIPETGVVELRNYYSTYRTKRFSDKSPKVQQKAFLRNVYENLVPGGRLYLAIENRFDYRMFWGIDDPHVGIPYTSILPRMLADRLSRAKLGRPYINWTYSFSETAALIKSSGFDKVELYMSFPDYRYPTHISPYDSKLKDYVPVLFPQAQAFGRKARLRTFLEIHAFRTLNMKFLAPSIIAIAQK